jgi:hypothetical protein
MAAQRVGGMVIDRTADTQKLFACIRRTDLVSFLSVWRGWHGADQNW